MGKVEITAVLESQLEAANATIRSLEPVVAIQVHNHAALVEALMALSEVRLYYEAEVLLPRGHLQYRSIVVAEMVIGPPLESASVTLSM